MPRKREFDPEAALDLAVQVFWQRGYADTSIDDIVTATGVNRYGLYSVFGDKHALFVKVLIRYQRSVVDQRLSGVRRPDATVHDILAFFEMFRLLGHQSKGQSWGCLLCNALAELGTSDEDVRQAGDTYTAGFRGAFEAALTNSAAAGHLPPGFDCALEAQHLTLVVAGLSVVSISGFGSENIDGTIDACVCGLRRALT
jgi:AcrR family transcriptional regulator